MGNSVFGTLAGKTISRIDGMEPGSEKVEIETACGCRYTLWHHQDCCEEVSLYEVTGMGPQQLVGGTSNGYYSERVSVHQEILPRNPGEWTSCDSPPVAGQAVLAAMEDGGLWIGHVDSRGVWWHLPFTQARPQRVIVQPVAWTALPVPPASPDKGAG